MTADTRQTVISGLPCPVTSVVGAGRPTLEAFLGDAEFTIDLKGHQHVVRGHGRVVGDRVRFSEKDHIGGKDVRVWHVTVGDDGILRAEAIAAF
jgi:hypothetical protein